LEGRFSQEGEPIINLKVYNPFKSKSETLSFLIDTGFAGGILLPFEVYLKLGLQLCEELKSKGRLATGFEVELRTSKAILVINGEEILCTAYTTLGVMKPLIGRELLKKTTLKYEPKNGKLELDLDP